MRLTKIVFFIMLFTLIHSQLQAEESYLQKDYSFSLGYNFISTGNSSVLVSEYASPISSPELILNLKNLAGHHKYMGDLNFLNRDDFTLHFQYDYSDVFRAEIRKTDFFHNLNHKYFIFTTDYVDYRADDSYFFDINRNSAFFKYKLPINQPYHIRFGAEELIEKGSFQKRFYGQARTDSIVKDNRLYSTSKPIDLRTYNYETSLDGIIGGVSFSAILEVANQKDKKSDASEGGNILSIPSSTRSYKHLSLYSNQTGQISYVVSFSNSEINNNKRDELNQKSAEYNYNSSSAIFTYYPFKDLRLYLRLKYEDREEKSPEKIRFLTIDYPTFYSSNVTSTSLNYGLVFNINKDFRFKFDGKSKETKRDGVMDNEWLLSNSVALEGKVTNTKIKIKETIENIENPYYRGTPKNLYKTNFFIGQELNEKSGIDFDFCFSVRKNDDQNYYIQEHITNSLMLTYYHIFDNHTNFNVYLGYDKERYKLDLNIFGGGNIPNTPYRMTKIYGDINLSKAFTKKSSAYTDIFYQRGYGNYYPESSMKLNEITFNDFYQYGITLGHNCRYTSSDTVKLELSYKKHTEKSFDNLSGDIKTIYLAWERRW